MAMSYPSLIHRHPHLPALKVFLSAPNHRTYSQHFGQLGVSALIATLRERKLPRSRLMVALVYGNTYLTGSFSSFPFSNTSVVKAPL